MNTYRKKQEEKLQKTQIKVEEITKNEETNLFETTTQLETEQIAEITTVFHPQEETMNTDSSWCYSEADLILLAQLINAEAGDECTNEHKMYVGQVVLNRIKDDRFPNTLKEVIYQVEPNQQYASIDNTDFHNFPSDRSLDCAKRLLNGENITNENVIYQSEFPQGKIIKVFKTKCSTTYICA